MKLVMRPRSTFQEWCTPLLQLGPCQITFFQIKHSSKQIGITLATMWLELI